MTAAGSRSPRARVTGPYPLEQTAEEMTRLRMQATALGPEAERLADHIGIRPGWRCLDLACGVGGITDVLARRVGPAGRVVGLDNDADKLAAARQWARAERLVNVEFLEADAYRTGLAAASFDLVHVRFVLTTVGRDAELVAEARRLLRPGGVLALQEADTLTLACYPPHPAWDRLKHAVTSVFAHVGGDTRAGGRMFALLRATGFEAVRFRPVLLGFTREDPMADFLPSTALSVRSAILAHGLLSEPELDEAVAACRRHLADPGTTSTSYVVFQAWGGKPG